MNRYRKLIGEDPEGMNIVINEAIQTSRFEFLETLLFQYRVSPIDREKLLEDALVAGKLEIVTAIFSLSPSQGFLCDVATRTVWPLIRPLLEMVPQDQQLLNRMLVLAITFRGYPTRFYPRLRDKMDTEKTVRELLALGACPMTPCRMETDEQPLQIAIRSCSAGIVKILLQDRRFRQEKFKSGQTPFGEAAGFIAFFYLARHTDYSRKIEELTTIMSLLLLYSPIKGTIRNWSPDPHLKRLKAFCACESAIFAQDDINSVLRIAEWTDNPRLVLILIFRGFPIPHHLDFKSRDEPSTRVIERLIESARKPWTPHLERNTLYNSLYKQNQLSIMLAKSKLDSGMVFYLPLELWFLILSFFQRESFLDATAYISPALIDSFAI